MNLGCITQLSRHASIPTPDAEGEVIPILPFYVHFLILLFLVYSILVAEASLERIPCIFYIL